MIAIVKAAFLSLRLYLLRRRQYDSAKLRHLFSSRYGIDVGMYSYGCFDRWRMPGPLRVGRYCSIASTIRSTNNNHRLDALTTHPLIYERRMGGVVDQDHQWDGYLVIEDDVWIGHNVVILPGCRTIGRGAVIGAGSIVTRDVAPYAVVAGNPARKLRDRFPPDLAAAIERTRWWELEMADLRRLVQADPEPSLPAEHGAPQSGRSRPAVLRCRIARTREPGRAGTPRLVVNKTRGSADASGKGTSMLRRQ